MKRTYLALTGLGKIAFAFESASRPEPDKKKSANAHVCEHDHWSGGNGGGGGMEASKERAGKQRSDARLINVKRTQSCIK